MSTLLEPRVEDEERPLSWRPSFMTSLLEQAEIRHLVFPISLDEYFRLTEDKPTELLRGIIIEKESKSSLHSYLADVVREILMRQLTQDFTVLNEWSMRFVDSAPEPDVAVVRGKRPEFKNARPTTAELVVEVAVTSSAIDRLKAPIYAEAGVKEYWIVRPERQQVEIYRQPTLTGYAETYTVTAPAILQPVALPGVSVDLAELFE